MRLRYWIVTGLDMLCAWLDKWPITYRLAYIGGPPYHWLHELSVRLERRWQTGAYGDGFAKDDVS